jgi:hypothetical protein
MKISELDENLKNNGIPRNWYSINEGLDEHYCIDEKGILKKNGKFTIVKEVIK